MQHVGAHLVAPGGVAACAEGIHFGLFLLALLLQQLGLQHAHGGGLVLDLGLLVLAGHDDAGWDVGQAHCGIRGVHGLPARTGGAVDVHADIRIRHLDGVRLLHDG